MSRTTRVRAFARSTPGRHTAALPLPLLVVLASMLCATILGTDLFLSSSSSSLEGSASTGAGAGLGLLGGLGVSASETAGGVGGAPIVETITTPVTTTTPCPVVQCPICEACPVCPGMEQCPDVKTVTVNGYAMSFVWKSVAVGMFAGLVLGIVLMAVLRRLTSGSNYAQISPQSGDSPRNLKSDVNKPTTTSNGAGATTGGFFSRSQKSVNA